MEFKKNPTSSISHKYMRRKNIKKAIHLLRKSEISLSRKIENKTSKIGNNLNQILRQKVKILIEVETMMKTKQFQK